MLLTFEIYKPDKRFKTGWRLVDKFDTIEFKSIKDAKLYAKCEYGIKASVKIYETLVERVNLMSGESYIERYDTPNYCSPASEAYWNM